MHDERSIMFYPPLSSPFRVSVLHRKSPVISRKVEDRRVPRGGRSCCVGPLPAPTHHTHPHNETPTHIFNARCFAWRSFFDSDATPTSSGRSQKHSGVVPRDPQSGNEENTTEPPLCKPSLYLDNIFGGCCVVIGVRAPPHALVGQ